MNKLFLLFVLAILPNAPINAQTKNSKTYNVCTSDLTNFVRIYSSVDSVNRINVYQTEYLDKGSVGLKDYASLRFDNAGGLVERIYGSSKKSIFYQNLCTTIQRTDFEAMKKSFRTSIDGLKNLYPQAVVPDVYLLVGGLGNGSTPGKTGLLIGIDSYLLCFDDRSVIQDLDATVAHELVHFNQSYLAHDSLIEHNLLAQVIKEGSADFIGELISGRVEHCNLKMYEYGEAHCKELWKDFQKDLAQNTNIDRWLYNDQPDRPASLGYFMGYKITKAYYNKAKNKKQAIKEILTIPPSGFESFLQKSGYDGE